VPSLSDRLHRLEAMVAAPPPPAGGPAKRTAADYAPPGSGKKGRKVASKAGAARYGLPIGTPLDGTHSKNKNDAATKASYDTFMAAKTPADLNKAASWMANDDLKRAGEALFSFDSKNERDAAARIALVKELAARGIDPHAVGYKGGPVVLNPNPKQDPTVKAANAAKAKIDRSQKSADTAAKQNAANAKRAATATDNAAKKATKDATTAAKEKARQELAQSIAEGAISEREARRRMALIH
jgi:ribosomal protein L14E/L6E/L27E